MSLMPIFTPFIYATVVFEGAAVDSSSLITYTFSSAAIGLGKNIIGVVGDGAARTVSTLTVGGAAATFIARQQDTSTNVELWYIDSQTDGTADIVVTWDGGLTSCGIGVHSSPEAAAGAPHDTLTSTADPMTGTIDCPAGGIIVAVAGTSGGTTTDPQFTWTGITETYEGAIDGSYAASVLHTGAALAFAAAQTGLTVTCDPVQTPTRNGMVVASWGPA